jgi:site-specific DNA-methyltransferase (cytosine-N4-specific)
VTKKSEIPFGAQFSPSQINLSKLLQIIHQNIGNRKKITEAICDEFFAGHSETQRWKLADNTVLALRAYGLLDEDGAVPTGLASELLGVIHAPDKLYELFAKYILVNLRGIDYLETIEIMQKAGEEINLHTLGKRLEQRGLHVPRGSVHLSSLRLWLAQAGIFEITVTGGPRLYEFNQTRLRQVLGLGLDTINSLAQLSTAQRAFLRALTRISEAQPLVANKVADLATMLYGVEYNHKELPKSVLFPLRDLGYLELVKSTTGRGAKPYEVLRTLKFQQEISEPILTVAAEKAGLVPKELFEQSLADILVDLKSSNKHVKGKALELLAIYLTRLIDLDFKGWLLTSRDSNQIEVQIIAHDRHIPFSQWQIQCRNVSHVDMGEIAAAVGRSIAFKPSIVMSVTTGYFTQQARYYATKAMQLTNFHFILLDADDLKIVAGDERKIRSILNRESRLAKVSKEQQLTNCPF